MSGAIDRFIPHADVRERHEILVRAPASLVFETALRFDLQSVPVVHAIFWLRAKILGAPFERMTKGLVEETKSLGWGELLSTPEREIVMGAVTQPWIGEVKFRSIPAESFVAFDEPDLVKIVWTLEVEPLGPDLTRFSTQTRALATDDVARIKFMAYWRKFSIGIRAIRRLGLWRVKKLAERQYLRSASRPGMPAPR